MLGYLLPGIAYGFAAAVTPGPLSLYLISHAVSSGWRRALPIAFAPLLSDGPIAVLILTVLSQVPDAFVQYLRLLGGIFILYLAFGAWKSWRGSKLGNAPPKESQANSCLKAVLINWLNPNPYLGWSMILGPMALSGWNHSPMAGTVLVLGFYLTMIAVMVGMVLLFSAARTLGPRVIRGLIGLSSMALACLGFYQLWLGSLAILADARY
jgi:threonine/homoserine/homoserine lactone efflux protein